MGVIDIVGFAPYRPNLYKRNYNNNEFGSMDEYLLLARKSITKFASLYTTSHCVQRMLKSDDIVSNIATDIMIGAWKYNGAGHKEAFLIQCAIYSIKKYFRRVVHNKKRQNKELSHNEHYDTTPEMTAIYNEECVNLKKSLSSILSTKELQYIYMHYFNNIHIAEIGRQYGVSRQWVYQVLCSANTKILKELQC